MKKNTLLTLLVAVVLLLNISLVLHIWMSQPEEKQPLHQRIVQEIGFDKEQARKFDVLRDSTVGNLKSVERRLDNAIFAYFSLLKQKEWNHSAKDSLQLIIGDLKKEKANILFTHFKDLRDLCRPDQLPEFNLVLDDMMELINPPPPTH